MVAGRLPAAEGGGAGSIGVAGSEGVGPVGRDDGRDGAKLIGGEAPGGSLVPEDERLAGALLRAAAASSGR